MRSSMNVSLPAPLKSWIEQQVAERGFSTASEFVRDLLRREQAAASRARVDAHLLDAIESGPARKMDRKAWDRIRSEGVKIARQHKANDKKIK
jgi:antitoxin ParD1/3/4